MLLYPTQYLITKTFAAFITLRDFLPSSLLSAFLLTDFQTYQFCTCDCFLLLIQTTIKTKGEHLSETLSDLTIAQQDDRMSANK